MFVILALSFEGLQPLFKKFLKLTCFCPSFSSAVIAVGSQEPLWAAVLQPARVISTSCALVPKTVSSSRTGRYIATDTGIWSLQKYAHSFPPSYKFRFMSDGGSVILLVYPHTPHTCSFLLHFVDLCFLTPFQMVTGKGFEVPRRVYVDFEGINLRRKFLTGLEPESINMTIGKNIRVLSVVGLSYLTPVQGRNTTAM